MITKIKLMTGLMLLTIGANAQVTASTVTANGTTVNTPIKGTPYLQEAYAEGVFEYADNTMKVPTRYNVFKDLMEYQQGGRTLVLDASAKIKKVQLGDETFVVEKFADDGKTKYGYFALLDSGKVTLYARKAVRYLAPLKGRALDGGDQPAEFRKLPDNFYFKVGSTGTLEEVKNIKSMIAAFPDKQDELTAFAKKEKISPRDGEELLQLVKYYNSLE
jgi:hypothetical protein